VVLRGCFAASVLGFLGQSDLRSLDLGTAFQLVVIGPWIRFGMLMPVGMWVLAGVHDLVQIRCIVRIRHGSHPISSKRTSSEESATPMQSLLVDARHQEKQTANLDPCRGVVGSGVGHLVRRGSGIATCVDAQGSTSPGSLNTSTLGDHTYSVTATSKDGQTGTVSVAYTVIPADSSSTTTTSTSTTTTTTTTTVPN
jgi:hypothetical protein